MATGRATLRIAVLNASGLPSEAGAGAYVVVSVVDGSTGRTTTEFKTRPVQNNRAFCEWNQEFDCPNYTPNDALKFSVIDQSLLASQVLNGEDFFPHGYDGPIHLTSTRIGVNARMVVKVSVHGAGAPIPFRASSDGTNRPPEPKPDLPIGSIGSFSSASPLSVTSYGIQGSRSSPQMGSGLQPAFASYPKESSLSSGSQPGSYQAAGPSVDYASLSSFIPAPRSDPFRQDPFAQPPSSSFASVPTGSQPRAQKSDSLQSRLVASIGATPPSRPQGTGQPYGSLEIGSQPKLQSDQSIPLRQPYGSLEIGSQPKYLMQDFPDSRVVRSDQSIPLRQPYGSLEIGSQPNSQVAYLPGDVAESRRAGSLGSVPSSRPNDQSIEIGSYYNSPQSQRVGSIGSLPGSNQNSMLGDHGNVQRLIQVFNSGSVTNERGQPSKAELRQDRVRRLRVVIENARGLRNADFMGKSDPYVICRSEGITDDIQTPVINNDLNPVWNHEVEVDYEIGYPLIFEVYDSDAIVGSLRVKQDDFLGRLEVDGGFFYPDMFHGELLLSDAGDGVEAYLCVTIQVLDAPMSDYAFDTEPADLRLRPPAVSRISLKILSASGLRDCGSGSRSECYVQAVDSCDSVLLETDPVLELDSPVWNFEQEVTQDGPIILWVCDLEQRLGYAMLEEGHVPSGEVIELQLQEASGKRTQAKLKIQVFPGGGSGYSFAPAYKHNADSPTACGTIIITVLKATLSYMDKDTRGGDNPGYVVVAEADDGTAFFETPPALSSSSASPGPTWNYKSEFTNYKGASIRFTVKYGSRFGAASDVLGRAVLRLDQFHPFGFEGDITISNRGGGGILGLLRLQVAIPGRSLPQAPTSDTVSVLPARSPALRSTLQDDYSVASPLAVRGASSYVPLNGYTQPGLVMAATSATPRIESNLNGRSNLYASGAMTRTPSYGSLCSTHTLKPAAANTLGITTELVCTATPGVNTVFNGQPNFLVAGPRAAVLGGSGHASFDGSGLNVTYKPGVERVIAGNIIAGQALPAYR